MVTVDVCLGCVLCLRECDADRYASPLIHARANGDQLGNSDSDRHANCCDRTVHGNTASLSRKRGSTLDVGCSRSYQRNFFSLFPATDEALIPGYFDGVGTSPDGKWLSYISYGNPNDQEITIESSDGKKKIKLRFEPEWGVYGNPWLSNEQLSFLTKDSLKTVVLNPFTGEQQAFLPDYPNFNNNYLEGPAGSLPLFFGYSNVAYDPSLRFVIYPQDNDDGLYDALWDRQTNREIAKVLTGGLYLPPPLWLSDSQAFVVTAFPQKNSQREWFMVGVDGEIHQLTRLLQTYFPNLK